MQLPNDNPETDRSDDSHVIGFRTFEGVSIVADSKNDNAWIHSPDGVDLPDVQ